MVRERDHIKPVSLVGGAGSLADAVASPSRHPDALGGGGHRVGGEVGADHRLVLLLVVPVQQAEVVHARPDDWLRVHRL